MAASCAATTAVPVGQMAGITEATVGSASLLESYVGLSIGRESVMVCYVNLPVGCESLTVNAVRLSFGFARMLMNRYYPRKGFRNCV